ncbi:hypothetical protein [Thiopseudomonas alkaliphila]|uniref:hypothetical protein n=1 Tax=Thiopseudomonas alkaliphila TaxID=1697053 RepID=UPI002578EB64|nr:hypothetical protein [Thiopseudomonas alkaliphila]MDM1717331.1 hypothetical protein [Thiopseudomonas alkaliphila]
MRHENVDVTDFLKLEKKLIEEFRDFQEEVDRGNLIDYDPDWVLESFMKEHFGIKHPTDNRTEDKRALLFYKTIGLKWCCFYTK